MTDPKTQTTLDAEIEAMADKHFGSLDGASGVTS